MNTLEQRLADAIAARAALFDDRYEAAFRLFNGFVEGERSLVVDLYGRTVLIHNYAKPPESGADAVAVAQRLLLARFEWIAAVVVKERFGDSAEKRNGMLTYGTKPTHWIRENGVRYAIDLTMNRDAGFYLDTRTLRTWLQREATGLDVLNTFAYTGSLGVAAVAGRANRVLQTDLNKRFLNVAKTSHTLNGFPIDRKLFRPADFWSYVNQLKRAEERFDIALIDPPFFSETADGKVDLAQNTTRLVNKVRPIVRSGGRIVLVNNALFVSGGELIAALEPLTDGGWVAIEERIDISADFTGYPTTRVTPYITNPAPFNHTTKIVVLRINHRP